MSPAAQAKLLRVLQEREFQRLGGTRTLKADVRVIAATNRDLRRAMEQGGFREDLYYRLDVFEIHIPPLRERKEESCRFVDAFLRTSAGRCPLRPRARPQRDGGAAAHHWPGNVRELRNVLERAAILSQGSPIAAEHLSLHRREPRRRRPRSRTSGRWSAT